MTNLSSAEPRTFRGNHLDLPKTTYTAGGVLYEGAAVQRNASDGDLENLTGAGTTFAGILDGTTEADGDRVNVIDDAVVKLTVNKSSAWAATDVGAVVYASDGNAFTLTSASNQKIGRVVEIVGDVGSSGDLVVWVQIRGTQRRDP